jgi:DNA-binding HxlR family transcriptional regulator
MSDIFPSYCIIISSPPVPAVVRPTEEEGVRFSRSKHSSPIRADSDGVIERYFYLLDGVEPIERTPENLHETVGTLLKLLSGAHAMSLVYYLFCEQRPIRFRELERVTSASPKVLSQRLKELVAAGLVTRRSYDESPPRVEYELTTMATELAPALQFLYAWAARYDRVLSAGASTEDETTDAPANAR